MPISARVIHLLRQIEVTERAEAMEYAARQKSKHAKADADSQALGRLRAVSAPLPQIPESSFTLEPLHFDFGFMSVPVNALAIHRQHTFSPADAKAVGLSDRSLLAQMENVPTGNLGMVLSSESPSFMSSTINSACSPLFALRRTRIPLPHPSGRQISVTVTPAARGTVSQPNAFREASNASVETTAVALPPPQIFIGAEIPPSSQSTGYVRGKEQQR